MTHLEMVSKSFTGPFALTLTHWIALAQRLDFRWSRIAVPLYEVDDPLNFGRFRAVPIIGTCKLV